MIEFMGQGFPANARQTGQQILRGTKSLERLERRYRTDQLGLVIGIPVVALTRIQGDPEVHPNLDQARDGFPFQIPPGPDQDSGGPGSKGADPQQGP